MILKGEKGRGGGGGEGGHSSTRSCEVNRPDHHCGGFQRVARAFPVVPLDPVEAIGVLALLVVDPVEVGRTTGVKPPAWKMTKQ